MRQATLPAPSAAEATVGRALVSDVPVDGHSGEKGNARYKLLLGALGVVYGDIGTSPLYTLKQCFTNLGGHEGLTPQAIFGVLSLISWTLLIVVTIKYVTVIMRADNRGEGGILALTALALRATRNSRAGHALILGAGLAGAALFYGDGIITPAISVLSAVEGLNVATPVFQSYVLPITVVLLLGLFLIQRTGTHRVGVLFGPVMLIWFLLLAGLGLGEIIKFPGILFALNPLYGLELLMADPARGFTLLGAVVLAVTGAEALYADMGHFGRSPIRFDWLTFVFPALLLNYFGQGALLLHAPAAIRNPFFLLAPEWALLPLVVLSGFATIIASQAVISGAFSMTRQAVQLGYLPRLQIRHTSHEEIGQIFVPKINLMLLCAVVAVVVGFRTSDNLGSAYGIAVTGTMSLTTFLAFVYVTAVLKWNKLTSALLFGLFAIVDLGFFGANLTKFLEGGWFPLAVAITVFIIMITWLRGREALLAERGRSALPLDLFLESVHPDRPLRVPGTAVFMCSRLDITPPSLLHNLKHNKVLHDRIVLMRVEVHDVPHIPDTARFEIKELPSRFFAVTLHYGFMDEPNIPRALAHMRATQLHFNLMETSFFVGREKLVIRKRAEFRNSWKRIFAFMYRSMLAATEFFRIPANRVIELGGQIEI